MLIKIYDVENGIKYIMSMYQGCYSVSITYDKPYDMFDCLIRNPFTPDGLNYRFEQGLVEIWSDDNNELIETYSTYTDNDDDDPEEIEPDEGEMDDNVIEFKNFKKEVANG